MNFNRESNDIPHYAIIVKPTHMCNFNCSYCYDAQTRRKLGTKRMTLEIVEKTCEMFKEPACITWTWHGGEPTMMSVEFYIAAQEIFNKFPHLLITQCMQSNGYNLSDDFIKMLVKFNIGFGMSTDGLFQDQRKKGSTNVLIENIQRLQNAGISVGAISVSTPANSSMLKENHDFIVNTMKVNVSFNPLFYSEEVAKNDIYIMNLGVYLDDLLNFYKGQWFDPNNYTYERSSMESVHALFATGEVSCHLADCKYKWIGVDPDGKLSYCDKTLSDRYLMGNVLDEGMTVEKFFNSTGYRLLSSEIDYKITHYCSECGYFDMCCGLCNSTVLAYHGHAKEPEINDCNLFKATTNRTFMIFEALDVFSTNLSPALKSDIFSKDMFTPMEIYRCLKNLGLNVSALGSSLQAGINIDEINITRSIQYKIFRLCNPKMYKKDNCYCRYSIGALVSELGTKQEVDVETFRDIRQACISTILKENMEDILKLVYGGV